PDLWTVPAVKGFVGEVSLDILAHCETGHQMAAWPGRSAGHDVEFCMPQRADRPTPCTPQWAADDLIRVGATVSPKRGGICNGDRADARCLGLLE
ncbi:MAG: hypothetical protein AAGB10_18235, partial [Pseudomonadota bacterium]